jgi:DNA-binding NtrC family response regulator
MKIAVLLVDDDTYVTNSIERLLYHEPLTVYTANSADEAIDILKQRPVHIAVVDEKMPGMTGSELLAHMRREFPDTARVMLTGQATLEAAVRSINEGQIHRFLFKPCHGPTLIKTIYEVVTEYRKQLEARSILRVLESEASCDERA